MVSVDFEMYVICIKKDDDAPVEVRRTLETEYGFVPGEYHFEISAVNHLCCDTDQLEVKVWG